MLGVQAYGDVRTFSPGDPIKDNVQDDFTDNAFAGYNAADGQYMLNFGDGSSDIFVCHTMFGMQGRGGNIRYPWVKYDVSETASGITLTSFTEFDNRFYMGASDGNVYRLDSSLTTDNSNAFTATLKSAVIEMPFGSTSIDMIYLAFFCSGTADLKLKIYLNGESEMYRYYNFSITKRPIQQGLYLLCDSIQFEMIISNFTAPVKIKGLAVTANTVKMYKG